MTLVQLRHLVSLAETGSFSKAAQAQFLTQPALSRSIRALEDELGTALFDRIGRRIELTPFGRETLERAKLLLTDADELQASSRRHRSGEAGVLRLGMGSGPGAMLMTPLLLQTAQQRPQLRLEIARGGTELLVQALRGRTLDALVVDARSLRPAADLRAEFLHEMRGAFMVRRGHPLARRRGGVAFDDLLRYPIASTPLSDEVARLLIERYGPRAHPGECVTLRCDELPSLVEVALHSDAVLLAIRAAAPGLVELTLRPALDATARFGLVTLARRSEPPGLADVRRLMAQQLQDPPAAR
ncbi:MAG: LysR family transcriptional regulator [Piscinibacter sp.]|uniref:LysR family transcriptional regulator n=1 Tax=Piscinibacter TaxID=1114981 RepID=UPI000FDCE719|nr:MULTISPECIES: LysR family transcriptional regulator [Piscinibacter]MCW5666444.1 LysR family transcriptional regulator [Piscinibacter sp.]